MKRREFVNTTVAAGVASVVPGMASAAASAPALKELKQPWPVRDTEAFEIESKAVGDTMAVGVWRPNERYLTAFGRKADEPMDLVYVLDGSFALGVTAAICLLQLVDLIHPGFPPLILVGLDYPVGATNARSRDYTMADSTPKDMSERMAASPKTAIGGADNFLRFMEEELDPLIRSRYNTTGKPAGILGDSFGGTFTFYSFLKQSKLFDRYWLGSPGIFTTDTNYPAAFAKVLGGQLVHDTKMFLSMGSLEANGGTDFYEDMGANFNRMVSSLNKTPNSQLSFKAQYYPDRTHTSVFMPAINDALLYLYAPKAG